MRSPTARSRFAAAPAPAGSSRPRSPPTRLEPGGDHIHRILEAQALLAEASTTICSIARFALTHDHLLEQALVVRDGEWEVEAAVLRLQEDSASRPGSTPSPHRCSRAWTPGSRCAPPWRRRSRPSAARAPSSMAPALPLVRGMLELGFLRIRRIRARARCSFRLGSTLRRGAKMDGDMRLKGSRARFLGAAGLTGRRSRPGRGRPAPSARRRRRTSAASPWATSGSTSATAGRRSCKCGRRRPHGRRGRARGRTARRTTRRSTSATSSTRS